MRKMCPKSNLHPAVVIVLAAIATFGVGLASTGSAVGAQDIEQPAPIVPESTEEARETSTQESPTDSVEDLLKQLDSPSFKEREAATERLAQLGPDTLKQIIVDFFDSSSEAGWRIHRVLEGIGKNSNEEDFLKSMAIIQILYGAQDEQSQRRLAKLQYQWKSTRRKEAARKLSAQGFRFASQFDDRPGQERALEIARMELMFRAARPGAIHIATGPEPDLPTAKETSASEWKDPRADRQQSILKIEKIIAGDAESNRQIVESLLPPASKVSLPPGLLEFPENWQPDDESFKLVNELSSLSSLTFRNQRLNAELCEFLSQQRSLQGLQLINCDFEEEEGETSKLKLPKSITNLVFDGSLPPAESLPSLGQMGTLKLSRVNLTDEYATTLSRCKVQIVELEEVTFDRKSIRRLLNMRGLFRVTMSLCEFELEWLEGIRKRNPNLISASPKAFLGVQGPIDISGRELSGCQISQVVPDTAAAKAGMRSLDVVTAMDGKKINRFEDLRLLISQKRPGDTMSLEVQRDGKKVDLTVKLGEMGQSLR